MNLTKTSIIIASLLFITSCSTDGKTGMNKQSGGTLLGGLAGGLLGMQFGKGGGQILAASAGALIGAYAGTQIGKSMDNQDKLMAERASQKSLETQSAGSKMEWKNPDTGHQGYVMPTRTFKTKEGQYCREFTQEVKIGNNVEKAYGTACRQPDGHWKIISTQ